MGYAEYIQIGIALVLTATLVAIIRQLILQNRLLQAQILAHRFEALTTTGREITEGELEQVHLWPDNYMSQEVYEKYKDNPKAMRKYLGALDLYIYLAFAYALKKLNLPDPIGYEWTEQWAAALLAHEEFREVHAYIKRFYPWFGCFLDSHLKP
ncbi:MAG: hypothetical protein COW04_10145 [Deltaproteobacteria bacterium CG12_big_fil_rev_8_21_14_0_65_43_10]|nr:MAG: hypothetical protein AUK23_09760 [Deltaproteobacteria bacterium CG2_30_43_15]PIQ44986.1 MAG: hypothetical protein COW04_10145 [Deltaproteobacteria bacterium CG12_big_fil_rev_8_21_14_0_65_43_10]PIU84656.1 MAG: hypothetical protein COS67_12145 [Deltaproteobacteria bacterium CG06_land_8_20_14_3_00_44_19]PIX23976.1 MAG: hypothetical protein COZ68_07675 [Deltaproteobacteria bacterium CG_4_8_14_3_um_filter_43_13]PIZ18349.1 MAG: hypothetical protein COY50_15755 [Deltaproteobacteria bacterium C